MLEALISPQMSWDMPHNPQEVHCLVEALWFESRGEPIEGIVGVANVIHNRKLSPKFPNTYCKVVNQPIQFSYTWDGLSDRILPRDKSEEKVLWTIAHIALMQYNGYLDDITEGADHYYNPYKATPNWSNYVDSSKMIGLHRFVTLNR